MNAFRSENSEYVGGVVLLFDAEIYGWKNELRDPQDEQPAAAAIDERGNQWVARGGDSYSSAEKWVRSHE